MFNGLQIFTKHFYQLQIRKFMLVPERDAMSRSTHHYCMEETLLKEFQAQLVQLNRCDGV